MKLDIVKLFLYGSLILLAIWAGIKIYTQPLPSVSHINKHYEIAKQDTTEIIRVTATVYYPTGRTTYSGSMVPKDYSLQKYHWLAISHDLAKKHNGYSMEDTLIVWSKDDSFPSGLYIIKDLMNARHRKMIDVLVQKGELRGVSHQIYVKRFKTNSLFQYPKGHTRSSKAFVREGLSD